MKKLLYSLLVLVNVLCYSQSGIQSPCATDVLLNNLIDNSPEARTKLEFFEENLRNTTTEFANKSGLSIPPAGSITIPVVVYIVHDGTALTNISDVQVNSQLTALNEYFLNTGIKFCLATKVNGTTALPTVNTSDVQNTAGIIHVNNATLSNHFSNAQQALVNTASPQITKERYLRIWVVKSIDGTNSGTLGYSMFPHVSPIFDGIVMRYDVFGNANPNMLANYNLGKILVHEVGHYLALYHTFEGGCSNSVGDCLYDGDRICDTPQVAAPNFNCVVGTNSCLESPAILDDLTNYMDYGNNNCQNHFTNGQIERMLMVLNANRNVLYSTENIIYTGTCGSANLISATITVNDYSPCASTTTPTSFSAPPSATYSWNFGDPFATVSNPNTANTQVASHIYTSAANSPYTITLTVTNANGDTLTSTEQIYVANCAPINNSNSYWYVDRSSGLDFATGRAVFDPNFPSNNTANLSCNSQCDTNGNLLFYTNNFKVWNRQHVQINPTDLMLSSNSNSSYQTLIVPKPPVTGNVISEYYIFVQQPFNSNVSDIGFYYNVVNVNGTTATMGAMHQPITLPVSYGFDLAPNGALIGSKSITAVKKCNNYDYWIMAILKKGTDLYFVVFSLTSSGLAYNSERLIVNGSSGFINDSVIEIAPNGNKIFLSHGYNSVIPSRIYDFNKAEGIVDSGYSSISLPQSAGNYGQIQGSSFSADSNLLYISNYYNKTIYQYNINALQINNTSKAVASVTIGPWGMQLGPDNKLYIAMANGTNNYKKLSVIHNPNIIATTDNPNACNFTLNGPVATNFVSRVGPSLPNIIDANQQAAYFEPNTPNVISRYITACNTYKFFPNVCGTSFIWTFTNTSLGTSFTTTVTNPTYNFSQNGTYVVTLKSSNNVLLGTSSPIEINTAPTPTITGSTTACLTRVYESITNNSTPINPGDSVNWSITAGSGSITGLVNNQPSVNINWTSLPGTITLTKVNAAGCTTTATTTISAFCPTLNNQSFSKDSITISPNPSTGLFTIDIPDFVGKINIRVFEVSGRIVLNESELMNNGHKNIDLSHCQSGMYIIEINSSEFTHAQKILKN